VDYETEKAIDFRLNADQVAALCEMTPLGFAEGMPLDEALAMLNELASRDNTEDDAGRRSCFDWIAADARVFLLACATGQPVVIEPAEDDPKKWQIALATQRDFLMGVAPDIDAAFKLAEALGLQIAHVVHKDTYDHD
jgi:hypothetical protein